jgi:triacylglycerol lipase
MAAALDVALGVLNGLVGDYLARTGNGLATEMQLVQDGRAVPLDRTGLARAFPGATPRIVLLVHGILGTEHVWTLPRGGDYGSMLARDRDYTPLYVRYNSGRAIEESGAALADLIRRLVDAYPVPITELLPIGYSMGGLVVRAATRVAAAARDPWLGLVRRAIYLGTPHRGAPLERLGRAAAGALRAAPSAWTELVASIADLRSAGMKDLGDAERSPLLPCMKHHFVAGTLSGDATLAAILGDAIVPVASATDGACVDRASFGAPPGHVRILPGVGHIALARHDDVYAQIRAWCEEAA